MLPAHAASSGSLRCASTHDCSSALLLPCSQDRDLNRDFPDRFSSPAMQPSGGEQPETAAMMAWSQSVGFVASASMHEVRAVVACRAAFLHFCCGVSGLNLLRLAWIGMHALAVAAGMGSCCLRTVLLAPLVRMPRTACPACCSPQGALVANYPWDGTPDKSTRCAAREPAFCIPMHHPQLCRTPPAPRWHQNNTP